MTTRASLIEQEHELMALLKQRVHDTFAAAAEAGVPAETFADVEAIADAMSAALPTSHVYDQIVGPFYDTAGLTRWWRVSRQAVSKKVATNAVIACRLDDGQWVYPTWQFTDGGAVHRHSSRCGASCAPPRTHGWPRCGCAPRRTGWTAGPRRLAPGGGPIDPVRAVARADAQRWAA